MRESTCEHRRVADDGRITCAKIVLGDDQVSANVCSALIVRQGRSTHGKGDRVTSSSGVLSWK